MRSRALLPLGLLVLLLSVPAHSQYLYLDTNGNGIRDPDDRLAPSGTTNVDIWLVTDHDRDGTPVSCDASDSGSGLTVNSYTVVLHAAGGGVKWGPMQNRLQFQNPGFTPVCFAVYGDTTGTEWYHNGWGSIDQFPPGRYLLATLAVTVTSGTPSIFVEPFLPSRPVAITQFGTSCMAIDGDNTYKLGLDWHDADGVGPLHADAGGPYQVQAGRALGVSASRTESPTGDPITFAWDFGDGGTGAGVTASHVYANAGDYRIVLTATSAAGADSDTTTVHVVPPAAPIAQFTAPYRGYVGIAVAFDGSPSYDPAVPTLGYSWDFGDGGRGSGAKAQHVYASVGTFTVTLTVDNGLLTDQKSRDITILAVEHPPVAVAGGPYSGIMGALVHFDGTRSSDVDGDALQYTWGFGDRTNGVGAVISHSYNAPGVYSVRLLVSDGSLSSSTTTTANIAESLPARAFTTEPAVYVIGQTTPMAVRVEPVDASFRLQDVTPWPMELHSSGTGPDGQIYSVEDARVVSDSDGNGVEELLFTFGPEELTLLLGNAEPSTTVTATIRGSFYGGGFFTAELPISIAAPNGTWQPVRIAPNPFNPQAVVSFSTRRPGAVSAHLFDVHGRLVRTLLDHASLGAGRHAIMLEARSEGGGSLASGIYFFRLSEPDGITTRRVTVAK
jgi:PKD repeat protein